MSLDTRTIAREFSISEDELTRESLRAFMLEKLRHFEADRKARCAKYGVKSLEEMDGLLRRGEVNEDTILEDFQTVDYLSERISRVRSMLREM